MSSQSAPISACLCPLCGQPNGCAMEAAKHSTASVGTCWCASVTFPPELLARVPEAAQRKACICQICAMPKGLLDD